MTFLGFTPGEQEALAWGETWVWAPIKRTLIARPNNAFDTVRTVLAKDYEVVVMVWSFQSTVTTAVVGVH